MSLDKLQSLLRQQPDFDSWETLGHIRASTDPAQPDLVLLNYTPEAMFTKTWNSFELVCRGLILQRGTGRVIARPFDKFFNYGEQFPSHTAHITQVYEKLDGSLGIGYYHNGKWRMASRGSLTGDHAKWGEERLNINPRICNDHNLTLLFEMIMPADSGLQDNLTVKYNWEGLCLLTSRNVITGNYSNPNDDDVLSFHHDWERPRRFRFQDMPALLKQAEQDVNFEGYVVWYSDGSMYKVKTPEYLKLNYLNSHFNKKLVWDAYLKGNTDYLDKLPDDVRGQKDLWLEELWETSRSIVGQAQAVVDNQLIQLPGRKEQAAIVTSLEPIYLRPIIFSLLDKKSDKARQLAGKVAMENFI